MARSRFSFILAACLTAILAVPLQIVSAVERFVAFAFSLIPTSAAAPRLVFSVPGPLPAAAFERTDPAVLNSLRHEAGMRRLP